MEILDLNIFVSAGFEISEAILNIYLNLSSTSLLTTVLMYSNSLYMSIFICTSSEISIKSKPLGFQTN